jgi:mitotic-spindle organizing protein 1
MSRDRKKPKHRCTGPEFSPLNRASLVTGPEATAPPEMETEAPPAGRQPKESVELPLRMSPILDTGLGRHTPTVPMALCDRGADPGALAVLVRDISSAAPTPAPNATAGPAPTTASLFPSGLRQP